MVVCEICGKEVAIGQCAVCGRAIGPAHASVADGKVFCPNHVPAGVPAPAAKPELAGLRKAIWTLLALVIGTGAILYIMQSYAASMPPIPIGEVATIIQMFQTIGLLIVEGLAGLLVLLLIAYAVLRRRK